MSAISDARDAIDRIVVLDEKLGIAVKNNFVSVLTDYEAVLRKALRGLIAEHDALVREMHHRELHHFESEKMLTEAGIDPDAHG